MVITTSTSPSTFVEPDIDAETTRQAFLSILNISKCTVCPSVGKYILNSTSKNLQNVQFRECSTNFSGHRLHELILLAKTAKEQPAKNWAKKQQCAKKSTMTVPSSAAYTAIKLENTQLRGAKTAKDQKDVEELCDEKEQLSLANAVLKSQNEQRLDNINNIEAASAIFNEDLK